MCRSLEEIERALAREETGPEDEAFRAHLAECDDCRNRTGTVADEALVRRVAQEGGHIEPMALSRYLDGDLPEHVRFLLEEHLRACPECRRVLAEMRSGRRMATAEPLREYAYRPVEQRLTARPWSSAWKRPSVLAPAFGAALAAAVAFLWMGGYLSREGAPDLAS